MTELQYIYNTSNARFTIPVTDMTSIKKVEFKLSYQNASPSVYQDHIFKLGGDYGDFVLRKFQGRFDIYWYNITGIVPNPQPVTDEIITCTYDIANSVCTWNGTDYPLSGTQQYASDTTMYIGGNDWLLTVYYFKMWDASDNLLHHFVGCDNNGTVGIDDKVTGNVYTPTTGTWLAGPQLIDQQLQYIYNTDVTARFENTFGVTFSNNSEVEMTFKGLNWPSDGRIFRCGSAFHDAYAQTNYYNRLRLGYQSFAEGVYTVDTSDVITIKLNSTEYTVNGTAYPQSGTPSVYGSEFAINEERNISMEIYSLVIRESGVVTHNYVGWNHNGTIGLMDLVENEFFAPTTSVFLAGPPAPAVPTDLTIGNKTVDSVNIGGKDVVSIYDGATLLWEKPVQPQPTPPIVSNCVCFEALEAGAEVQLQRGSNLSTYPVYLYASTDNGQTFTKMERNQSFSMPNIGDKVYIYGNNTSIGRTSGKYYTLTVNNKQVSISGDLTRLLNPNGVTTLPDYAFNGLFQNSNGIVDASGLTIPVTTVGQYALRRTFAGCTTLQYAPTQLGATNLSKGCYSSMFANCTSLITVPTLPATTLAEYCYIEMFHHCTSLTTAPALPALTMENYCYSQMFEGCTSLTTAPVLPALTLDTDCYNCMFRNCTSLNSVTCLATDISALDCTDSWLENVSSTGTFTKNPNMSNWPTGISGIPTGWTVQNYNPVTQAEYVTTAYPKAAGTFIDTGIYPTIDTVFKVKYKPIATNDLCVVGFAPNGTPTSCGSDSKDYRLFYYASLTQGTFDFNSSRINGNLTTDTDGYLYVEVGNNYIKDLNVGQTVTTGTAQSSMQTTTVPMYLDLSNSEQMHSLEIWEGQTKVYDGYAAHNGTNYGWYDAVGNTFTTQTYGGYTITGAL